jgi:replication-associated recombination protein RarA
MLWRWPMGKKDNVKIDFINSAAVSSKICQWSSDTESAITRSLIKPSEFEESITNHHLYFTDSKLLTLTEAMSIYRCIVLLGDAGDGKSTLLKQTFMEIVSSSSSKLFPFYVSLNAYTTEDIKSFIEREYSELPVTETINMVFLFDEFDQIKYKDQANRKPGNFGGTYGIAEMLL